LIPGPQKISLRRVVHQAKFYYIPLPSKHKQVRKKKYIKHVTKKSDAKMQIKSQTSRPVSYGNGV